MRSKLFLLLAAPALLFSGCKKDESKKETTPGSTLITISKEGTIGNLTCRVNTAENTKKISTRVTSTETENNFVILNVTFVNNGVESEVVYSDMVIYHRGQSTYEPNSASIYLDKGFFYSLSVDAGLTKTVEFVYEIPSEFELTDYLELKENSFSTESINIYFS